MAKDCLFVAAEVGQRIRESLHS